MKSLLFLSILRFDVLENSKYKLNIPDSKELKILILINLLQTTGEQGKYNNYRLYLLPLTLSQCNKRSPRPSYAYTAIVVKG